jgi:hypothetical protein
MALDQGRDQLPEWGMKSGARSKPYADLGAGIELRTPDVLAILWLLGTAQVSVRNYGDELCAGLLAQCAAQLRERYGLAEARSHDDLWSESSLIALVHLLVYVQAEVRDKLDDISCALALSHCIERMLQTHMLHTDGSRDRAVTSH